MDIGMSTASYKDLKSNGIVHIGISHVGQPKTVLPSLYPLLLKFNDDMYTVHSARPGRPRVMLRHNIDTKAGLVNGALVNGALGTVACITPSHVSVKCNHITQPYLQCR